MSATMAIYDFRCTSCGLEFEVSRPMAQAADPARCPVDGAESQRFFTMPATFSRSGDQAPMAMDRARRRAGAGGGGWSHHGHRHGRGAGHHTH
jgi:putative FmdB family regulatory protein